MRKAKYWSIAICLILQVAATAAHSSELRIWNSVVSKVGEQSAIQDTSEYTSLVFDKDTVRISRCSVRNRDILILGSLDQEFKFRSCESVTRIGIVEFEKSVFARAGQKIKGTAGSIVWSSVKTLTFGYISVVSFVGTVGTIAFPPIAAIPGVIFAASAYQTVGNAKETYRMGFGVTLDPTSTGEILNGFANRKSQSAVSVVVENYDVYMNSFYQALKYRPNGQVGMMDPSAGPNFTVDPLVDLEVLYLAP